MTHMSFMPEKDLLSTILADLKRTSGEYATAVTESNCPVVRQVFTDLTNETLKLQGDLFNLMSQLNMYPAPSPVLKQDVENHLQQHQQTMQQTEKFVQQKLQEHGMTHSFGVGNHQEHQGHTFN